MQYAFGAVVFDSKKTQFIDFRSFGKILNRHDIGTLANSISKNVINVREEVNEFISNPCLVHGHI